MARTPQGFPRTARLTRPSEFRRVFAHPRRSSDRYLTVLAAPNDLDHPRLGLAISRKVSLRAVQRNRIKRLIRECFRHLQAELGNLDFVVIGRHGLAQLPPAQLNQILERHWKRLSRQSGNAS